MKNELQLMHVSLEHDSKIELFLPRIPNQRADFEDDFIERICASDSIRGCFIGHPNAVDDFCPAAEFEHEVSDLYYLPKIEESGRIYRVYHFNVLEDEVMTPSELLDSNYVPDAYASNEHWILNPIKPIHSELILLRDVFAPEGTFQEVYSKIEFDYVTISESDLEEMYTL